MNRSSPRPAFSDITDTIGSEASISSFRGPGSFWLLCVAKHAGGSPWDSKLCPATDKRIDWYDSSTPNGFDDGSQQASWISRDIVFYRLNDPNQDEESIIAIRSDYIRTARGQGLYDKVVSTTIREIVSKRSKKKLRILCIIAFMDLAAFMV